MSPPARMKATARRPGSHVLDRDRVAEVVGDHDPVEAQLPAQQAAHDNRREGRRPTRVQARVARR
jgi:hypothetical protein